ncbi:MAG: translocation/assembly module TamB domain-containing protein [Sulfitobacter sp.]
MQIIRYFIATLFAFLLSLTAAYAQDDDKGFLTNAIQDALSGAGRSVSIDGFSGALSSEASFDRMTISDKDGVWLTLDDVVLDWNRSALLRGRLEVQSLTAKRLDVPRLPVVEGEALPDAEAKPFALPDLPVSIEVADFSVGEINLGAPILGEAAQLTIKANARLTDDVGALDFTAKRTDTKRGEFAIKADFKRSDNVLELLLKLAEEEEGIAARLLNIPGQPTVDMTVAGKGPLDDFVADVKIATDGEERLAGEITLGAQTPRRSSDTPDRRIQANIGGDITALLAPRYREFFGPDVRLTLDALREGNGAIEVSAFTLDAQAAELAGKVTLNSDAWPTFIDITGTIANPDDTPILLPVSGTGVNVSRVGLRVAYDAADGEAFDAIFDIDNLDTAGVEVEKTTLELLGTLQGNLGSVGQFLGDVTFEAAGLSLTDAASAEAIGDAVKGKANINYIEGQPIRISDLDMSGADYGLKGKAVINGLESGFLTRLDMALTAADLSRFSALVGREIDGSTALALKGTVTPLGGQFDVKANGSTQDIKTGIVQADAVLAGLTQMSVEAQRNENGTFLRDLVLANEALILAGNAELRTDDSTVQANFKLNDVSLVVPQYDGPVTISATATQDTRGWSVDAMTDGPYGAALTAKGLATGPNAALTFTADVPDVKPFAEQIDGPVKASGTLSQSAEGWVLDTNATGPFDVRAAVKGLVTPAIDIAFDVSMPNLNPLVPQLNGPLSATGKLRQTDKGFFVDTNATGPYGARALVEGLATGPDMSLTFDVNVPNVNPLVPGVSGPLAATGVVRQTPDGIEIDTNATGPYASRASAQGVVTGPNAAVDFDVALPNIGSLVAQVSGPLDVTGSARKQGDAWRLDTNATGPSGTQATIAGLVNGDGTLNLDVAGSAPLGLSKPFIAPRDLQGQARFDLEINGPAQLSSVTGTIQASGATLSAPNLRVTLRNMAADVRLANNRAQLDVTADATNGGRLRVDGAVTLTPSLPADIQIGLQNVVLIDPKLYRTSVGGNIRVAGPLTGGALISGQIDVGETNVNIPSTGVTSIGDIPPITHIGARPAVIATRRKAGLDSAAAGTDPARAASGSAFGLNLRISAPNRIFVRGRGLDAELGGALNLTGSSNRVISAGRFELIRGRLDILGKRFDLVEGSAQFQGDLIPYLRFVSTTTTRVSEVSVIVEGPADEPEVKFESNPDAPQDEVLAQLLFGRNIGDISAFQALQLAGAVATLAGKGGSGIISNLRDGFGLDDFDVTTTEDGATALRAGKYLSENVYTDVTAASDGSADISLNLDITPNLKGKVSLGSDGDSSLGIFFEKDY